jgi:uncharacterized protein (TIGR02145 family)
MIFNFYKSMEKKDKKRIPLIKLALLLGIAYGCSYNKVVIDPVIPPDTNPYNGKSTAVFNSGLIYGTIRDIDGNIYKTITIGTQTWMAENLRTAHYRNGEPIPQVTGNEDWSLLSTGAYCNFGNTENDTLIATYGRLYNWYAVNDSRNIAPKGWHVPSYEEWMTLVGFLGSDATSGGKMKESGLIHWLDPNTGADNNSGFTSLPGSIRGPDVFYTLGETANYWSSNEYEDDFAFGCCNLCYSTTAYCGYSNKYLGFSIRCVKD